MSLIFHSDRNLQDVLKLAENVTEDDLNRPEVKGILPKKASYEPGESIQLVGTNLNPHKASITVILHHGFGDPGTDERRIPLPSTKDKASPSFVLPDDLQLGKTYDLWVIREVDGKVYSSNVRPLPIIGAQPLPLVPQPTLTDVTPQRRPGDTLILSGTNFIGTSSIVALGDRSHVQIEPMDLDGTTLSGKLFPKVLSPTQLEIVLPLDLTPGLYRISVSNVGEGPQFSGIKVSEWVSCQILPHSFQVNFLTMHCIDESSPEVLLHDTLVTTWAIAADETRKIKSSKTYDGFDDNDTGSYSPEDCDVFSGEVKHGLVLTTQLYEWDAGDVQSVNEVIQVVGDIASEIGKLLADKAPTVSAILLGVKVVSPFLQKAIAYFGGDSDLLGEQPLAFPVADLQKKTQNANEKFAGELPFINDGATGSYKLTYEVVRLT